MSHQNKDKKMCLKFLKEKNPERDFYKSYSKWHGDGLLPYCKTCLKENLNEDDINSIREVMRILDRPYFHEAWEKAKKSKSDTLGKYLKDIALNFKEETYDHSDFINNANVRVYEEHLKDNEINDDLTLKWGSGYTPLEIQQLEKFYDDMIRANDISTPQHKAQLELLCKVYLEQNKALAEKRFGDFKNLNSQYNQILRDSGFRPIDKQGGGESVGIRTFSQIWEEIERDGFIKPAPIEENQDIVDKTIMYMANYTRKLLNLQSLESPPDDTPKVSDQ